MNSRIVDNFRRKVVSSFLAPTHPERATLSENRLALVTLLLMLSPVLWAVSLPAAADGNTGARLIPRAPAPPAELYHLAPDAAVARLVIKFHEGTHVRLRDGVLQEHGRTAGEEEMMQRLGLTPSVVAADAAAVESLVGLSPQVTGFETLFTLAEEQLETWKTNGEQASGRQLADLNLYFEGQLAADTTFGDLETLLQDLNALASLEVAYAEPPTEVAGVVTSHGFGPRGGTPDFQSQQGYLNPAPQGIDAYYAWTVPGGAGAGTRIIDIEYGWNTAHEDLPNLFYHGDHPITPTPMPVDPSIVDHGTAVLGEMVGLDNGFGVKGIAYQAQIGGQHVDRISVAAAIGASAAELSSGDIILIEVHRGVPDIMPSCSCFHGTCGFLPVEFWQAEFDAIAVATATPADALPGKGLVVVEAAGNGSAGLDDPAYGNLFDRSVRDSGAIMVGAAKSADRRPTCFTNYGSRIDVFGWGENVVTTGGGDLYDGGSGNQWYTASFLGTSSASPIVAGAAASLQGVSRAAGLGNLSPAEMRQCLVATGTPQAASSKDIGKMPDLRAAIASLLADNDHNEPPTAQFSVTGTGLERTFDASASTDDEGIVSYEWSFPRDVDQEGQSVSHFFPGYRTYTVRLTVTDTDGATHSVSQSVPFPQPNSINPKKGLWYNPARSGNGIDFTKDSSGNHVLLWFTYTPGGDPIWYISGAGNLNSSRWHQPLYRVTWDGTAPHQPLEEVGSVTLDFHDDEERAWFSWVLDGQPGEEPFQHFFGGQGRSGLWYDTDESGWGTSIAQQVALDETGSMVDTLVATVYFFEGSQPRWVQGTVPSGDDVVVDLNWITGEGLCPSCEAPDPDTSLQPVGNTRLQIDSGSSTSGLQDVDILPPSGAGHWLRTDVDLSRITGQ